MAPVLAKARNRNENYRFISRMQRSVRSQEKTIRYRHYANCSAEVASHAFVSRGYYDKTYQKLLEDNHKEMAHLQVELDIPNGGPDQYSP